MKKKSIAKNYIYNTIYQIIAIIIPIITTPYISRVLGANNIGIYSYTISIATYFVLFGSLGIALYGRREIAYLQDDKKNYSKTFWEIVLLRIITMAISSVIFYFVFASGNNDYQIYYKILLLELIGNTLDISWFFQGLEDFKKPVLRNIISVACIFLFVKSQSDLTIYLIIFVLSTLIGNVSLWFYLPKYLNKIELKELNIVKHLNPTIALFIPQIAIQVYTVLDKTMIGTIIIDKAEVGFYEQAQKIVKIFLTIIGSLGTVMMPRIAYSFAKKDKEQINQYMIKSINATLLLALPLIFGICVAAENFVPLFFGDGYDKVIILMQVISPILLLIGLSGNIGTQYLLPTKQQWKFTLSVILGAVSNFVFNMLLIPKYGALGASIGTVIAETVVTLSQMLMTKNQINYKEMFKLLLKYLCCSLLMFGCCYLVNFLQLSNIYSIIVKVLIGIVVYGLILIIIKDDFVIKITEKIKEKI